MHQGQTLAVAGVLIVCGLNTAVACVILLVPDLRDAVDQTRRSSISQR